MYQVIQYHPRYSLDADGRLSNDKTFMLPSADPWLLAVLTRRSCGGKLAELTHLKDEALSPMG